MSIEASSVDGSDLAAPNAEEEEEAPESTTDQDATTTATAVTATATITGTAATATASSSDQLSYTAAMNAFVNGYKRNCNSNSTPSSSSSSQEKWEDEELGVAPMPLPLPLPLPLPKEHPAMWAISFQQLLEVKCRVIRKQSNPKHPLTMRDVNDWILRPLCDKYHTSYALHKNPNGLKIDVFVTHCWDEPFLDFVECLERVFLFHKCKPNLWICAFAMDQHAATGASLHPQENDIYESPFLQALQHASKFTVVRNAVTDLCSRSWCIYELFCALELGLVPEKTYIVGPNKFSHISAGCLEARASYPEDEQHIREALLPHQLLVDSWLRRLRQVGTLPPSFTGRVMMNLQPAGLPGSFKTTSRQKQKYSPGARDFLHQDSKHPRSFETRISRAPIPADNTRERQRCIAAQAELRRRESLPASGNVPNESSRNECGGNKHRIVCGLASSTVILTFVLILGSQGVLLGLWLVILVSLAEVIYRRSIIRQLNQPVTIPPEDCCGRASETIIYLAGVLVGSFLVFGVWGLLASALTMVVLIELVVWYGLYLRWQLSSVETRESRREGCSGMLTIRAAEVTTVVAGLAFGGAILSFSYEGWLVLMAMVLLIFRVAFCFFPSQPTPEMETVGSEPRSSRAQHVTRRERTSQQNSGLQQDTNPNQTPAGIIFSDIVYC